MRRHLWFKVLTKLERSVLDLTVTCVDRIRSDTLSLVIGRIASKLLKAFKSKFLKQVEVVGVDLAWRISRIAAAWGYVEASDWKRDLSFIRFCGVNVINNPSGYV